MKLIRFDRDDTLILVDVRISGPLGEAECRFAFDTAATTSLVEPGILDSLGYSPLTGDEMSSVTSPVGREVGYLRRVENFCAFGFEHSDFQVNALDLDEEAGIDGLLGLNFLRAYNYEVRSRDGVIRIEPA
jgi:hypothetical protein